MIHRHTLRAALAIAAIAVSLGPAGAQDASKNLRAFLEGQAVPVTVDNFVRAATDLEFDKYRALAGGVNRFVHVREPTPVERQPTIRMNRDTLYSIALIDISEGATLILPDTGERYISAHVINQDHYMNEVFLGGGSHALDTETFDTDYVLVIVRTLVDAADSEDVAEVNALQDAMRIEANSSAPFVHPNYDEESFNQVLSAAIELARFGPDSARTFGRRETVDPVRYFMGAASGWGGLPEDQAFYLNVEPQLPVKAYKLEVPAEVPTEEFWSISLYNAGGFFQENAMDAYNVNSVMGERNDDGSMTVHFGGCEDGRVNCLPIMEGWNYTVRLYRPGPGVLDGSWTFPAVEAAE